MLRSRAKKLEQLPPLSYRLKMKLYEKMGFVVEGVKRRGVRVDGHYEDLICMGVLIE